MLHIITLHYIHILNCKLYCIVLVDYIITLKIIDIVESNPINQ